MVHLAFSSSLSLQKKPKIRLLIVDGHKQDAIVYRRFLETKYQIDVAMSGEEAVTLCSSNIYDCLLIDYELPDFNGYALVNQLGQKKINLPSVLIKDPGEKKGIKGVQPYMIKGTFDQEKLDQALQTCIKNFSIIQQQINKR